MNPDGSEQQGFSRGGAKNNFHPVWSPDGVNLLYHQMSETQVPVLVYAPVQEGGLIEHAIPLAGIAMLDPAFSPDGRWIAFEGRTRDARDIYLISANGLSWQRLTTDPAWDFDPAWRPLPSP